MLFDILIIDVLGACESWVFIEFFFSALVLAICFPFRVMGSVIWETWGPTMVSARMGFVNHVHGRGFAWIPEISHLCRILGFRSFEECGGRIRRCEVVVYVVEFLSPLILRGTYLSFDFGLGGFLFFFVFFAWVVTKFGDHADSQPFN